MSSTDNSSAAIEATVQVDEELKIKSTSVQIANDLISRQSMEHFEMRRLGLPVRFGKSNHSSSSSKRKRKRNSVINSNSHSNKTKIDNDDEAMKVDEENLTKELSTISLSTNPDILIDCDKENGGLNESDMNYEDSDLVEEVSTIRLSNDSSDYLDIDSNHQNNQSTTTSGCDDEPKPLNEQRKRSKKKKKKNDSNGLNPYWRQRFILFSLYAKGIKLDDESWYSVTPEPIARHIANKVEMSLLAKAKSSSFVIMDGFCGAGGNTIQFALCPSVSLVYAIDIDPEKIALARHNATIYGCAEKIEFIVADFMELVQLDRFRHSIDVCFLSPPWGGRGYLQKELYSLRNMTPDGFEIVRVCAQFLTKNICFLLPRNFDQNELEPMSKIIYKSTENHEGPKEEIKAEIEENRIYSKVKTMTAYFGDLVQEIAEEEEVE